MKKKGLILAGLAVGAIYAFTPIKAYAGVPEAEITTCVEVVDNREYADLVIAIVDNSYVNIRKGPGTDTEVLGKLYNHSVGHFIEEDGDWVKIKSGTVEGYVSSEWVVRGLDALKIAKEVEVTYATINTGTLNVRSKPTTESSILGTFSKGDELVVITTEDGFAKVTYNNKEGYISLEYVDIHTEFVEAESIEEERARLAAEEKARKEAERKAQAAIAAQQAAQQAQANAQAAQAPAYTPSGDSASLGQQVVDYAVQFVGNPYVYGGTSLTNGCDCSGFVQSVYKHFDVSLPRTGQRYSGYAIGSLAEAQPGDILCYSGHVAIYMGNGQIVHAATPSQGIVIGDACYTTIIGIRRIF
ncbi:MAG: SH3 domain-containing protein [Lachnospiraceae bacterium]|nr:SH3 domain-containing protein [Lachnospiraceae bacterium]